MDSGMEHEVIAGGAADGIGGASDAGHFRPERANDDVHHAVAGEHVGEGGWGKLLESIGVNHNDSGFGQYRIRA